MTGGSAKWPRRGLTRGHIPDADLKRQPKPVTPVRETCAPVIAIPQNREVMNNRYILVILMLALLGLTHILVEFVRSSPIQHW